MTAAAKTPGNDKAANRILVTGGCGFIGSNLVPALVLSGFAVRILDNAASGCLENLEGHPVELVVGDIRDQAVVRRAMEGCDSVIHLAAEASVLESVTDPRPTFEVNVGGTLTLLQAAVHAGARRFIFASSNAAIGDQEPPLDEGKVPRPISPYGASKLAAEAYCLAHHGAYGLGTVVLRFSNVYGPWSQHKTSVVSKFIRRMLAGEPITVYGDGQQTRDFIYVADVVQAIIAALTGDVAGGVFQIGTGRETSVCELIELIAAVAQRQPKLEWVAQPAGEIRRNYVSIDRARSLLGFTPARDLEHGLRETFEWLRSRADRGGEIEDREKPLADLRDRR